MNINVLLKKKDTVSVGILRIILVLFIIISSYPIIFVILTSLKSTSEFLSNIWAFPSAFKHSNYIIAWTEGHIGEYFLSSVIVTATSLVIILITSSLAGYALARLKIPFSGPITVFLFIIMILPIESIIIPLYIMMTRVKLINIRYVPMILAYIGWCIPFSIIVLKNFFQTIPNELLESSKIDGATELQTLWKIVVPLMAPALGTCTVFNFCAIWGELMWAQIATSAVDVGLTLTCGMVAFQGQYSTDWGPMCAAICMIIVPLVIVFIFLQKYFVKGLTIGAVKG